MGGWLVGDGYMMKKSFGIDGFYVFRQLPFPRLRKRVVKKHD